MGLFQWGHDSICLSERTHRLPGFPTCRHTGSIYLENLRCIKDWPNAKSLPSSLGCDHCPYRRVAGLALQPDVGILSPRWPRHTSDHSVAAFAAVRRTGRPESHDLDRRRRLRFTVPPHPNQVHGPYTIGVAGSSISPQAIDLMDSRRLPYRQCHTEGRNAEQS